MTLSQREAWQEFLKTKGRIRRWWLLRKWPNGPLAEEEWNAIWMRAPEDNRIRRWFNRNGDC